MAKQTFYFPHDGNARNDDKIIAVRLEMQMEGYGIYFAILERLLESSNYIGVKDYNVIAFDLRVSADKIKKVIENFGLFEFTQDGKHFYSESLIDRMKPLENIREQRKIAGKKSAEKRAKNNGRSTVVENEGNVRFPEIQQREEKEEINPSSIPPQAEGSSEEEYLSSSLSQRDGIPRNLKGMKESLERLHVRSDELDTILKHSNYGEIGHQTWALIAEARTSPGIKMPGRWIISKLLKMKSN